jgi:hypothetical protein
MDQIGNREEKDMSDIQKQITGRSKPLVRLWDRDFNLLYSCEGDLSDLFDQVTVTIDDPDGSPRKGGLVESVQVTWNRGSGKT